MFIINGVLASEEDLKVLKMWLDAGKTKIIYDNSNKQGYYINIITDF